MSNYFFSCRWKEYVETMRKALAEVSDPNEASIERAMPGVNRRFDSLSQKMGNNDIAMKEGFEMLAAKIDQGGGSVQPADLSALFLEMALKVAGKKGGEMVDVNALIGGVEKKSTTDEEGGFTPLERATGYMFRHRKPKSITDVYNEYHGLEEFHEVPINGGVFEAEFLFGKEWQRHFSGADQKHFSRVKQLVSAIDAQVRTGKALIVVLGEFDGWFAERKFSLAGLVAHLQDTGIVPRKVRVSST